MLRGNLSTRPFYNERLVALALGLVALVAVALTAFNAWQLVSLSRQRAELNSRIDRDRAEAARISRQADALQKTVDRSRLQLLVGATREANGLIDQRTFSWTVFFGLIEKTLPLDVHLVGVSPRVEKGAFKVAMRVVAKSPDDLSEFVDALLGTGAFYDVLPSDTQRNDDGTDTLTLIASYLPPAGPGRESGPAPAAKPKRGERP